MHRWGRPEGWPRESAHHLGIAMCRDHMQFPAFAPDTSEVAVGLHPVCIVRFIIAHACSYFSPLEVFCVLLLQMFVTVQVLK